MLRDEEDRVRQEYLDKKKKEDEFDERMEKDPTFHSKITEFRKWKQDNSIIVGA